MYDKFNEVKIVNLGIVDFESSRYEIWSGGKLIKADSIPTSIRFNTLTSDEPKQDGIEVIINSFLNEAVIPKKTYFDIGYTSLDRIRYAIIPRSSNCQGDVGFDSFLANSPIRTREHKNFNKNEPYAAGLFLINGVLDKVTFSVSLSRILIEFYR